MEDKRNDSKSYNDINCEMETNSVGKLALFFEFFKIGIFTIGGGLAMIPIISDIAVNKKKWITEEELLDCITASQVLPGVIAINIATYIGYKKQGVLGGIVASIGSVTPAYCIVLFLYRILKIWEKNVYVVYGIEAIKATVIGLLLCVVYTLARKVIKDIKSIIIAITVFIVVGVLQQSAIISVILAGLVGIIVEAICNRHCRKEREDI